MSAPSDVVVTAWPVEVTPSADGDLPAGAMVLVTGRNRAETLAAAKAGLSAIEIETQ
jgi:hypothetical protein